MVRSLDHINIRVRDLATTLRFYDTVLRMPSTPPPGMPDMSSEAWIRDAAGRPVIHVGTADLSGTTGHGGRAVAPGSGSIHHIALDCVGYIRVCEDIERSGIRMRRNDIAAARLRQIFIHDPDDVLIELNFRDESW